MKKYIYIFLAFMALIVTSISCSRPSVYQATSEISLIRTLKAPDSYKLISFEQVEQETLKEQIQNRMDYFSNLISYEEKDVQRAQERLNECKKYLKELVPEAEQELGSALMTLQKNKNIYTFLAEKLDKDEPALYQIVSRTFKLTYESINEFNAKLREVYYTRFNEKDKLVATKNDEDSSWDLIGEFFSIPGYYELVQKK